MNGAQLGSSWTAVAAAWSRCRTGTTSSGVRSAASDQLSTAPRRRSHRRRQRPGQPHRVSEISQQPSTRMIGHTSAITRDRQRRAAPSTPQHEVPFWLVTQVLDEHEFSPPEGPSSRTRPHQHRCTTELPGLVDQSDHSVVRATNMIWTDSRSCVDVEPVPSQALDLGAQQFDAGMHLPSHLS